MNRSNKLRVITIAAVLAVSSSAVQASVQTHHCKLPDGTTDTAKTKKQCIAAKGAWAKDAPAARAAPATAAPVAPASGK